MKPFDDKELEFMAENPDKAISYLRQRLKETNGKDERDEIVLSILSVVSGKLMMPLFHFIHRLVESNGESTELRREIIAMFASGIIFAPSKDKEDAWAIFELARKQLQESLDKLGGMKK